MLQYLPALVIAVALAVMTGIVFAVALCTDYRGRRTVDTDASAEHGQ